MGLIPHRAEGTFTSEHKNEMDQDRRRNEWPVELIDFLTERVFECSRKNGMGTIFKYMVSRLRPW